MSTALVVINGKQQNLSVRHTPATYLTCTQSFPRPQRRSGFAAPPVRLARPSPALGQPPARCVTVHDKARSCQTLPVACTCMPCYRGCGAAALAHARAFGLRQAVWAESTPNIGQTAFPVFHQSDAASEEWQRTTRCRGDRHEGNEPFARG